MTSTGASTAGPQSAGYVLQLERALYHLAVASSGADVVALEHLDDVAVLRDGKLILSEQDKNTSKPTARVLNDRSRALWRTLQIWLKLRETPEGEHCRRHLLFINQWLPTPLATSLRDREAKKTPPAQILAAFRAARVRPARAKIDTVIDDVLSRSDEALIALIQAIEVVEASEQRAARATLANGLAGC